MLRTSSRFVASVVGALLFWGCSPEASNQPRSKGLVPDPLIKDSAYESKPLVLALDGPFDMCAKGPTGGLDLTAARWLSFFAANSYAHPAHFAPILEEMGFGEEGEGEEWVESFREAIRMGDSEWRQEIPEGTTAAYERDLLKEVVVHKKIQFFSGGKVQGKRFVEGSTQMIWAEHRTKKLVIVSVRGTQEGVDFLVDADVFRRDFDTLGAVHGGFLAGHEEIEEMLKAKLAAESGRGLRIWVTGHSLGGAVALLASTEIAEYAQKDATLSLEGLYTFGQPRVGTSEFASKVDGLWQDQEVSFLRFRLGDDAVTKLPPTSLGFAHGGHLVHLTAEGTLETDLPTQELGATTAVTTSFEDHGIKGYYSRIVGHLDDGDLMEMARRCP